VSGFFLFPFNFGPGLLIPGAISAFLKSAVHSHAVILGKVKTVLPIERQKGRTIVPYVLGAVPEIPAILMFHIYPSASAAFIRDGTRPIYKFSRIFYFT
jgi:hypothetical protein